MTRYTTNGDEAEFLQNIPGLTDPEAIRLAEFEGFLMAEIFFTEQLKQDTRFDVKYICDIHRMALGDLYHFAGNYRTVNMSKGGFVFPAARFIPENMKRFNETILLGLPNKYSDKQRLIKDIARVHGELLFIHPFREGNGRTARILANLMARKQGYPGLDFKKIDFEQYIIAVQQVGALNYTRMEKIISDAFHH